VLRFVPFDPQSKLSEATVTSGLDASAWRVIKGAFETVSAFAVPRPEAAAAANALQRDGYRVLAVAFGPPQALDLAGLIALSDPPRADAAALIAELGSLGVRTVMVTGDAPATAAIVARNVGLPGPVCPTGALMESARPEDFAVYAGVLPEDKYALVKTFQKSGHIVGMCGDGANDAPALRQAQIGIAVVTASDVAKSAAGIVLMRPGLAGIVAAVKEGRVTFGRIFTYTLNSVVKKIVMGLLLAVGLIMTGHAVLTPMLMVILMIIGDFLAMSLTTDNVTPSPVPNVWRIGNLTIAGVTIGLLLLGFCSAVLAFAVFRLHLSADVLRTCAFVAVAFGSQATIYAIRERRHCWLLRPGRLLIVSSVCDVFASVVLAGCGILMAPLAWAAIAGIFGAAVIFGIVLDVIKIPLFARLQLT